MAGRYVLALDQGTSSSRALIVDAAGEIVGIAAEPFPQIYPRPGWVEHDPEAIWGSQVTAARRVIAETGVRVEEIAALGITNQRETVVVWDRATGEPIANAIVWQCRRTADACEALKQAGQEPFIRDRTGLVIDAYFSGTKIAWLLDNVPGARRRAEAGELAAGTIDSWLIFRLTGGRMHCTDPTNASRTMLFNLGKSTWDAELCELLRVPQGMLPALVPSSGVIDRCDPTVLGASIPIAGIAGDQQAALFGQACFTPGDTKNTYGTGCFVLRNTGDRPYMGAQGLLATAAASGKAAPTYALEGSIFVAGAAVQWLRDGLGIIRNAADVEALAALVQDSGGVYFVPAFVGLGAPDWDQQARGTLVGITRGTTAAHIARATLDAIAFQTASVLELFDRESGPASTALRVDGGAAANDLLMQTQADMLGSPVVRPRVIETTALGAAFLAGIGCGVWSGEEETAALWRVERTFEPRISAAVRAERLGEWRRAVQRSLGWAVEHAGPDATDVSH